MTGRKPIIRSAKLHHTKRTVVERQELTPHEAAHVRWSADLAKAGSAVVVAGVIGVGAAAQAAPRDPELAGDAALPPTPAAEVALAPLPDEVGPLSPRILAARTAPTLLDAGVYAKVSELKENPYVVKREAKKPRIVKKARATEDMFPRVDELKANPYE